MIKEEAPVAKRRVGTFRIAHDLLKNDWRNMLPLFAQIVIVRAESNFLGWIEYTAFSDLFEEIEDTFDPPEYMIEVTQHKDKSLTFGASKI